jgi:invasion protein IalB
VKLSIDQGASAQIRYAWRLANTCVAVNVADASLIGTMETGKKLTLEVVDSNVLAIATSVPLDERALLPRSLRTSSTMTEISIQRG